RSPSSRRPHGPSRVKGAIARFTAELWTRAAKPESVRSLAGVPARLTRADQTWSLISGSIGTPSRARRSISQAWAQAFARIVDPFERLQGQPALAAQHRLAKAVEVAAHGQSRRAGRAAEVEGEGLGCRIAPELEGHQRQQHALPRPGRPDHQGVTDIANVVAKAEGRGAVGPRMEQRRSVEVGVPVRPGPDG